MVVSRVNHSFYRYAVSPNIQLYDADSGRLAFLLLVSVAMGHHHGPVDDSGVLPGALTKGATTIRGGQGS